MLSDLQREMARKYIELGTKTAAYKAVNPDWETKVGANLVGTYASKAFTKAVMDEVGRLKAESAKAERKAAEEDAEYCRKLWSKRMAIEQLVDIVRDCERSRKDARDSGEPVPSQIAFAERNTIETLNKMMGYNEPEKQAIDNTINITFGDGGEDWSV